MKSCYLLAIPILISSLGANAEVSLDGTLGSSGALPGPDYLIGADLGRQLGSNLFHSFKYFNLNRSESATFSGPNSINNVISRVTGGNPSNIDGLIRSTISNADMYLLNPHGIMFGENAKLDVQGSFHASTADYLRLGDGGRFDARQPNNSLLTVAPVEAFGFLTNSPASLSIEGSKLSVPSEETLSLIGGNLTINQAELVATFGRINLASVAGIGEVIPKYDDLSVSTPLGDLTIQNSQIASKNDDIYIRDGSFELINNGINTHVLDNDGSAIDIVAENLKLQNSVIGSATTISKKGATIKISVNDVLTIGNKSALMSFATNSGSAGNIEIKARQMVITDGSMIFNITSGTGSGGNIDIDTHQMTLKNGSMILNTTFGSGDSGNIIIRVIDTLTTISGASSDQITPNIITNISPSKEKAQQLSKEMALQLCPLCSLDDNHDIGKTGNIEIESPQIILKIAQQLCLACFLDDNSDIGKTGNIEIEARQMLFSEEGSILSGTIGSGDSGTVNIVVADTLTLSDGKILSTSGSGEANAGNAGDIEIKANQIILKNEAQIDASTFGPGQSGNIVIQVDDSVNLSSSSISAGTTGTMNKAGIGGLIMLQAKQLIITDSAAISTNTFGHGNSGNIILQIGDSITLSGGAYIDSSTQGSGKGGTIDIKVSNALTLSNSYILGNSNSVAADAGDALDIVIEADKITLTDGAQISSATFGPGTGGTVIIEVADTLMVSGQGEKVTSGISGIIEASQITLTDKAQIASGTFGLGEDIFIIVADDLTASGQNETGSRSGIFGSSQSKESNAGKSGNILVQANRINLTDGGVITTGTANATGGSITVTTPALLYLRDGQITTSVKGGKGDGGNITIEPPTFVVMDDGIVIAQAVEGHGGNITIDSQQFVRTTDAENIVDASSKLGISGNVVITAPENDIAGSLIVLSANLLDVSGLLQKPCSAMSYEEYINRSRLLVIPLAGSSLSPFDLKPSHLPRRSEKSAKRSTAPKTGNGDKTTKVLKPVALVMACRAFTSANNRKSSVSPEQLF